MGNKLGGWNFKEKQLHINKNRLSLQKFLFYSFLTTNNMKKFILVASLMMFSLATYAQHEVGTLTVQPKVGLNVAILTDEDDVYSRLGLVLGAEFEYQITKLFSLSAGALYSMQGEKEDGTNAGTKYKATMKLDYINMPILANIYVTKGLAVKFGIQPGFNISSKMKVSQGSTSVSMSLSDLGFDTNSFDFSIPIGLSYEFNNFVIDGRYNIGVTKVIDDFDYKNRVFQFTVGYKFKL